jgi:hypothetical protein
VGQIDGGEPQRAGARDEVVHHRGTDAAPVQPIRQPDAEHGRSPIRPVEAPEEVVADDLPLLLDHKDQVPPLLVPPDPLPELGQALLRPGGIVTAEEVLRPR